ncbi:MAG: restriction endonuclease subunit S [Prevotella sp.]|nr:restriction endonuclease subunit S [Prevotella sp.]
MGNVPHLRFPEFTEEWETYKIADILCIGNGRDYKHLIKGDIPVFGTGGYMTSVNECLYEGETTFIGRKGTINKPFYYNGKFWTVDTLFYTHSFKKVIPKFVYCLFLTINWLRYNEASGVPSLSKDTIEKIKVRIPQLDEQKKIAEILSLLDERIATQNKVIEKLESLIKGLRQRLLSPKQGWTSYRLDELCQIKSGYSGTQVSFQTAYKVSRIETISKHSVDMSRTGFVKAIPQEYKLNVGDILFSNINSVQYIGNTAYIDKDYGLYHGMNLLRIIPNSKIVFPRFIHLLLCTDRLLRHFQSVCNKAVSQASINQTSLGKTIISIPSYEKQKHICCVIESVERKLDIETDILETLQHQKKYLLGAPDKPCGEGARMLAQNCCYTIHEERDVSDSFHLCPEAFDL